MGVMPRSTQYTTLLKRFTDLPIDCKFKYIYRGTILFIALACCITVLSIGIMLYPTKIIEFKHFEVYDAVPALEMKLYQIRAGEELEFEIEFEKYQHVAATVTVLLKQVNNGYLYPFPEVKLTKMPLGRHHYRSSLILPKATPPGMYIIIRQYHYEVNNLRTVEFEIVSNQFEVVPPGKSYRELLKEGNLLSLQNQQTLQQLDCK
jgi:hypothetical protein